MKQEMKQNSAYNGFLIFVRWLTMLTLGLWLGGIAFLGAVTAPLIFRFLRSQNLEPLAPQLFGVILERFSIVGLVCGVLALCAWLLDGAMSKPAQGRRTLWSAQGGCTGLMLAVALYLQLGALPALLHDQMAVIKESQETGIVLSAHGTEGKSAMRLRYDALHQRYSGLTMVIFWLGAAGLVAFAWRVTLPDEKASNTAK
jgi:hypothetical protein